MQSVSVSVKEKGRPAHVIRVCGREAKPKPGTFEHVRSRDTGGGKRGRQRVWGSWMWAEAGSGSSPASLIKSGSPTEGVRAHDGLRMILPCPQNEILRFAILGIEKCPFFVTKLRAGVNVTFLLIPSAFTQSVIPLILAAG